MTHFEFDPNACELKGYDVQTHAEVFRCDAHGEAIGGNGYGIFARCPPGSYKLFAPRRNDPPTIAEGSWFIALDDVNGYWLSWGRSEIGIHGGGTGSPDPLAPRQGWYATEGCIRVQNEDLQRLALIAREGDECDVLAYRP